MRRLFFAFLLWPAVARADDVEEVRVLGRSKETTTPTEQRLTRNEVRSVPGAFGDPFRAIDVSPSLVPVLSGMPYFYVRGAPPSAVGYYVDEIRVPYLFHFGLGPGVIQPALVDEVALHPAAFPARFGRYAGGIVEAQTRGPATVLRGEGQIRAFDAGAYVEAPFASGRGSAGIGGRYSYTAAVISLAAPNLTLDYRDYNARASYQLSDRWRATAFTFGAFDYASQTENGRERIVLASEFHRLDVRLDRRGDDGATSRIAATVGYDRSRLEGNRFAEDVMTSLRARHRVRVRPTLDVEIGADATIDAVHADLPSPYAVTIDDYAKAQAFFQSRTDTASGAWASATYRPWAGWSFIGTARADVFTSAGKIRLGPSPRLAARVPMAERVAFLAALGVAPQPPAFPIPVPAVGFRGLPGGLSYAYEKSAGAEVALPLRFTLRTMGFHHTYLALRDFTDDASSPDAPRAPPESATQAYGLELNLARKLSERFSGFLSGSLSRTELGSTSVQHARVSHYDRTWVFQIGGAFDLGRGWRSSGRFLTYRGWPQENADPNGLPVDRLPEFFRIDLRLEKRWSFASARWLSFVIEGLNVTATKDITSRNCLVPPGAPPGCHDETFGPLVIPSVGLEGGL